VATLETDRDRHVIPRLRSFASAIELEELASLERPVDGQVADEFLTQLLVDWELEPSISVAADLVSSAVAAGKPQAAREAARFILASPEAPLVARKVAGVCVGEVDPREISAGTLAVHAEVFSTAETLGAHVRRTRQQLIRYPADAVLWTNLATLYLSLGQRRQALRALRGALSLAPQNRFVLRSASRILVHLEKRDESHAILRRADGLQTDPWILSAEISIAADNGHVSENIKLAERLLEKERFAPGDTSELAAEIATIRALDGNTWAAKKALRRAMQKPRENALAQAAWLSRVPGMPAFELRHTNSNEANALLDRQSGKLRQSMIDAQRWLNDQPFSSRPAQMGSAIGTRIGRDEAAIEFAEQGLRTNPDHAFLLNNLAFSAARIGQLDRARASLRRIDMSKVSEADRDVVIATQGCLAFREGDAKRGRMLYTEAVRAFREKKDIREAVALAYHALEETRAGTADAPRLRGEALELAKDKLFQPEDRPLVAELENANKVLPSTVVTR
jgi:tetratricopeptide (TPR) repeat protein